MSFDAELQPRLTAIRGQGLLRGLRRVDSPQGARIQIGGQTLLNFSSNDYLGLANDPRLKEAALRAVDAFGTGAGASRLICGSLAPYHELEETLAHFKGTEAALSFSSGYATAVGTICALLGRDDVVVIDKLVHACIVDATRLSGAKLRVFAHNDLDDLENKLKWAVSDTRHPSPATRHILIVTESIFSMDGDAAPLREMAALKEKYGAWLMVDEAHATGLYGKNRRGLAEELGVGGRIEVQMGTLGKALGAGGGYICGSRTLIDSAREPRPQFYFFNRTRARRRRRRHRRSPVCPIPRRGSAAEAALVTGWPSSTENQKSKIKNPGRHYSGHDWRRKEGGGTGRGVGRTRHFRSSHPLSHRRARPGPPARDADRIAFTRGHFGTDPRAQNLVRSTLDFGPDEKSRPIRPPVCLASVHPNA